MRKGKIDRREIHDDARRRIEVMNIELRLLGKIENDARSCLVADDARLLGDKRPGGMGCGDDGDMGRDGKCKGACKPRDSRAKRPCPTEYRCAAREIHGLQEIPYFSHFR